MELPNNLTSLKEVLVKLPQERIAKVISAVLIIYITYVLSQLTWLLMPKVSQINTSRVGNQTSHTQSQNDNININKINALNLFGIHNAVIEESTIEIQDAPETRLNLTLSGVVASSDASTAAAIIENKGKQETYGIGELITGTRAVLESVANDRVLIKQAGRLETLMLDGFSYSNKDHQSSYENKPLRSTSKSRQTFSPSPTSSVIDQRNNKNLQNKFTDLKETINDEPSKIIDYLKIVPKRKDGAVVGYRLMPGKDPEFFKLSGLKSGDVAVQVNGLDLTIPSQAVQALQVLKQEQDVSLLVDRSGAMTEILFSVN